MGVIVQSFGEFKSSQMANAVAGRSKLTRYVLAATPSNYEGPPAKLDTYKTIRYLHAVGNRIFTQSDFSSYWANKALDGLASRSNPECDLFVGYSGSCLTSLSTASEHGTTTMVYRGAPHGRFFLNEVDQLLSKTGFNGVHRHTPRMTPREHREYELADLVWVPSEFTATSLMTYGVDKSKIEILPYGVDLEMFEPDDRDSEDDEFELLYVGEVSPEKGIHVLLKAVRQLRDDPDPIRVTLVGNVSDRLRDDIAELDIVRAVGWVDRRKLPEYYRQATILMFPSLADGYPSAILEGLACGCPVLTTRNVGTRKLIEEYGAGEVFEPGSATAIVEAVRELQADPERLNRMAERAVEAISENDFEVEKRQQRMAEFMLSNID